MRTKPTIIAFKTPSLENWDPKASAQTADKTGNFTQKEAEEGKVVRKDGEEVIEVKVQRPVNYPVGKPLEVRFDFSQAEINNL